MIKIDLNNFSIANNLPFVLIAGPCVIENEEHTLMMAEEINNICSELKINFIFKSSFDKANRSSIKSKRGVSIKDALEIFKKIINDDKQFPSLSNQKKWQYDIFENDNEITIVAEVPGPEKEILIDVINKTVKISNENFSEEIKLKKEVKIAIKVEQCA